MRPSSPWDCFFYPSPWLDAFFMPLTLNSSTTTPPAPEGGTLFTLATRRRHAYGDRQRVMPHDAPSGHEQHEWRCQCCPLVKITVLPQGREPYRAYRRGKDGEQIIGPEPECVPVQTDRGCRP